MKRIIFMAIAGLSAIAFTNCRKNQALPAAPSETVETTLPTAAAVYYDFVVGVTNTCSKVTLTINDCGNGSYKSWPSAGVCNGNNFNGTVAGSGNPLLGTSPATFPNVGATYLIFVNTWATRDVLQVIFKPGYNASHQPTVTYHSSTRKFTISSVGNPTYVSITKFSYTGLIGPGGVEFC
jgi:hypothetical protein